MGEIKKQIPINEKILRLSTEVEEPHLIGVKCKSCGEYFFPKRDRCLNCCNEDMEEINLSKRGKIYTYTIIHHSPPGYNGPVPYAVGAVELPEGIIILSPLKDFDFNKIKVGMDVEVVFEKIYEDDKGNDIIGYKFKPC